MTPADLHTAFVQTQEIGSLIGPVVAALILAAVITDYFVWVYEAGRHVLASHADRDEAA